MDLANGTIVTEGPHCALVECLLDGVYMWPCHGDKRNGAGFSHLRESRVTNSLIEPQEPLELQAPSTTCCTVSFCTVSSVENQKKPPEVVCYSDLGMGVVRQK